MSYKDPVKRKEWEEKNKDKRREWHRRSQRNRRDNGKTREYYYANKEKFREYARKWRSKNREKFNKKCRQYHRKRVLTTSNGKFIYGLNKRDYTGYCEVCMKTPQELGFKRLEYHHWNDDNPSIGIWICYRCHKICHVVDRGDLPRIRGYIRQKELVEEGKI